MNHINLLIKPASGNCNMRCDYCFYHSLTEQRAQRDYGLMALETLEILVKKAFTEATESITFAFQGGEPTLCGLGFYMEFEKYVHRYNADGIKVNRAFQTNGLVIDESWCEYFKKYNYLVGLSMDGPDFLNNLYRKDTTGQHVFDRVMMTKSLFDVHEVPYNVLCVVTGELARYGKKVYQFFKNHQIRYIQFINCLDDLHQRQGTNEYSLTWKRYLKFQKDIFDIWYEDIMKGDIVSIRYFDNYVAMIAGHPPESCNMNGFCSCQFVIEADGSVYPCDFYVTDDYRIGTIHENSLREMAESEKTTEFIQESLVVNKKCRHCKWYPLCRNGCKRERFDNLNEFCEANYNFFNYSYDRMVEIAKRMT
ncbi:MAG: anaerobic sulfatase maturase [Clostridia bacterium]|nr:anaerobic sulfatase maturase [Clostridia bacterium]